MLVFSNWHSCDHHRKVWNFFWTQLNLFLNWDKFQIFFFLVTSTLGLLLANIQSAQPRQEKQVLHTWWLTSLFVNVPNDCECKDGAFQVNHRWKKMRAGFVVRVKRHNKRLRCLYDIRPRSPSNPNQINTLKSSWVQVVHSNFKWDVGFYCWSLCLMNLFWGSLCGNPLCI